MRCRILYSMHCVLIVIMTAYSVYSQSNTGPCRINNGGCDRTYGLCWGTGDTTHFCTCLAGYQQDDSSFRHTCVDVDECATNPCDENADCFNSAGSYECRCKCGYTLDYTGQYCLDPYEIDGLCLVPGRCRRAGSSFSNPFDTVPFNPIYADDYYTSYDQISYVPWKYQNPRLLNCKCESGFTFDSCGYCVDENECYQNPCQGFNTECVNTEGSYYCACTSGYQLGPCGTRCYAPQDTVPELCEQPDLGSLLTAGIEFRTYNNPIIMRNYRNCASGTRQGDTTTERLDLDLDGVDDVILTWVCHTASGREGSLLKNYAEEEASWDEWSCWTACKATCWGGLQTRVRRCKHGLPGVGGCPGRGSEKRSCYNGRKCPFRVRKDAMTLTQSEINDLVQAMEKYKEDMSATGFHNAASAHGWPFQCNEQSCCPHGAKMEFITWHRTILLNYEEGLVRYMRNKQLGIPYWNWLRSNRNPPSLGWNRFINGRPNPFANMTVLIDRTGPMRTIQRDANIFQDSLNMAHDIWNDVATEKIEPHIMHEFAESLESSHGGPHVSVCGEGRRTDKCEISLGVLNYAGFDPLFMLHHSQVDRLWAVAQKKMEDQGRTTWSAQTALEKLEPESNFGRRQMPFGDMRLNPFPIVQTVNTMRDTYYYEELTGIQYDNIDNNGFPTALIGARALRPAGDEMLFIGHYFQSDTQNFYVNYYLDDDSTPCNRMTSRERIGGTLRLGTSRPFRLTVPHMTLMGVNLGLDRDLNIKACYTADPNCRQRCPELRRTAILTMPSPNLVYYLPNTPVDIYKFKWEDGQRMPNFYINLDAKSHWLYFYGSGVGNIRQVQTASEYRSCNSRRSRAVRCSFPSGSACALRSGIYYLIDSNSNRCRNGLKMIVVSRID